MTTATPETVIAVIREHGPITKTEVSKRIYGNSGGSGRVEKILDELRTAKRVMLSADVPKNNGRGQRCWVYSVMP